MERVIRDGCRMSGWDDGVDGWESAYFIFVRMEEKRAFL